MGAIRLGVSVRTNAGAAAERLGRYPARLRVAASEFARDGTEQLRSDVVDLVARRTGMSGDVAHKITNSRMEGPNRGLVLFERPRKRTIRPNKKKALAWPGGRHPVAVVKDYPGSRPWALIGRAANSPATGRRLEALLVDKTREALD